MRKEREENGVVYSAKYFELFTDPYTGEEGFKYCKDYWEDRVK